MKNKGSLKQIQIFFSPVWFASYIYSTFALSLQLYLQNLRLKLVKFLCVEKQFVHMYILQYIYIYAGGSSQLVCGQSKTLLNIFQCMVSISKSMQLTSKEKPKGLTANPTNVKQLNSNLRKPKLPISIQQTQISEFKIQKTQNR